MDRRQFLQAGVGATFLGPLFADSAESQAQSPTAPEILAAHKIVPVTRKLVLDAHSRNRCSGCESADEVARGRDRDGVRRRLPDGPGLPGPRRSREGRARSCPRSSSASRSHGLQRDADQGTGDPRRRPSRTRSDHRHGGAGRHHPLLARRLHLRLQQAARAAARRDQAAPRQVRPAEPEARITLVYDTAPGAASVGGVVLDLLPIMKRSIPKYIGFHWDTGHMAMHGDDMWETLMRLRRSLRRGGRLARSRLGPGPRAEG